MFTLHACLGVSLENFLSVFTSRAHVKRANGWSYDCFPRLFVSLSVRPHLSCAQHHVMHYYCTNHFWKFVGQESLVCCQDGEKVVGSRDNPVFTTYSY